MEARATDREAERLYNLDGVKGKGHYVGTYIALTTLERYWWGEGEMKFYIDGDDEYPTICGTGTEDYFGGAWSFATQKDGKTVENTFCTPFLGYPYYSHHDTFLHNDFHNDDQLPSEKLLPVAHYGSDPVRKRYPGNDSADRCVLWRAF